MKDVNLALREHTETHFGHILTFLKYLYIIFNNVTIL
jgi:hypothetical protein